MTSLKKKSRRKPSSHALGNIVGCRISHGWKEGNEPVTHWKAIILGQLTTTTTTTTTTTSKRKQTKIKQKTNKTEIQTKK
jgi:hypothetical protein